MKKLIRSFKDFEDVIIFEADSDLDVDLEDDELLEELEDVEINGK